MNYLEWILAWDRWKQINQPPATVISLWHELMSVWNRCGWMDEFTVPNGLLQIGAGLSRKEFDNARGWLISRGRVYYTKSKRVNQAGRYRMLPFPSLIVQNGQREGKRQGKQGGQREGQRTAHTGGTLIKLNETKLLFLDYVYLTQEEYDKLISKLGRVKTDGMIERLNSYAHQKPKKFKEYASHYHTILAWVRKDEEKDPQTPVDPNKEKKKAFIRSLYNQGMK